ncbi:hypothetical protein ACFVFJ_47140 [Streptomyces sp. NPDC057717]|uniref:hypothetical protein n=1 Tax=Streptomyces sp. NPDC057717 TaxID=3346224 RepID=UPI0036750E71
MLVGALVQHAEALIGYREGAKALESARTAVHILRELRRTRTRTDADPILMPPALSQLAAACTLNGLSTEAAEHSAQCRDIQLPVHRRSLVSAFLAPPLTTSLDAAMARYCRVVAIR